MTHREILKFIKTIRESFTDAEKVYMTGGCYQFYLILKQLAPYYAVPYYNNDHIITEINGRYYDIRGEVKEHTDYMYAYHCHTEKFFRKFKYKPTKN